MRHRGFATLIALGLIGLIGATLAVLAVSFSNDVKRNARQMDDAQLRQLLGAGEIVARSSAGMGEPSTWKVELPEELGSSGMSISFERVGEMSADRLQIRITARTAEKRSATETITLARAGDVWSLQSAELD